MRGQGKLISRLIRGMTGATVRLAGAVARLTKSPDPPSRVFGFQGFTLNPKNPKPLNTKTRNPEH